ncbi:MAG: phosphotransferase, partial [Actinobacteria bacterium]|nr:phosphotransferase [Actinomycetota bacterium]
TGALPAVAPDQLASARRQGGRVTAAPGTPIVNEAALQRLVEDALPRAGVATDSLVDLEQALSPTTTSYTTVALTARLRGGRALRLFLKDFGYSRLPKDSADSRRRRELHVYRDLLAGTGLGAPEYYGALWDEHEGRRWLLLEHVDGVQLRDCEFDAWIPSAAWLAQLHAHFDGRAAELEGSPLLIRHDEDYFRSKAANVLRAVRRFSARSRRRALELVTGYDELALPMASQPLTLVHGNYQSKNIVIGPSAAQLRVAPVDWEVAAVGSALYDLGHLLDGYRGKRLDVLLDAYGEVADRLGLSVDLQQEALRLMHCYCLHRVIKSLGRAVEKGFADADVSDLLDHGEQLRGKIFR